MMIHSKMIHIYSGKILNLMCVTTEQDLYGPPDESKWAINGSEIDFGVHRGGINIQIVKRRFSSTLKLTILYVHPKDSGLYECRNYWYPRTFGNSTEVNFF